LPRAVEWEAVVDGHVCGGRLRGWTSVFGDPLARQTLYWDSYKEDAQVAPDGSKTYSIRRLVSNLGTGRVWTGVDEELTVIFDPGGRVIERVLVSYEVDTDWRRWVDQALGRFSPF
jgi:hypothetical protein